LVVGGEHAQFHAFSQGGARLDSPQPSLLRGGDPAANESRLCMLTLEPLASVALPPISPRAFGDDEGKWTLSEKRLETLSPKEKKKSARSPEKRVERSGAGSAASGGDNGIPSARDWNAAIVSEAAHITNGSNALLDGIAPSPPPTEKPKGNPGSMKGRAVETWLNHTLGSASTKPTREVSVSRAGERRKQGLTQFGIDAASLERLGLDSQSAERVYRAMFVYSQGLHAMLQEAVGKSNSSSQALLVLWRAFTTVLEHAGQSEEQGAESLSALIARGNEEEKARIKEEYEARAAMHQVQSQRLMSERKDLQQEIQRLREDESRLRNDNEMYRNDHSVVSSKYEREIKQRVVAEVRAREKTRWADALQDDLNKERKQSMHASMRLQEVTAREEDLMIEVDNLRSQVKVQDAQSRAYKQAELEAAQQKLRHEAQVERFTLELSRANDKISELKVQLEEEVEQNKRLSDQHSHVQREMRKLEVQFEDESHARKECQNERDSLRERVDRMDREASELQDERRMMQIEMNDLTMKHRTMVIELDRCTEQLEKAETQFEKLEDEHRKLTDAHRALKVESEYLREDVQHFDTQLKKESELRKLLQHEKKQLSGQLNTVQIERDAATLALQNAQNELQEVTQKLVKLEYIVRDTKASMQKIGLEHQSELKAYTQKVTVLEKTIADERKARRTLVDEVQEVMEKRDETLGLLKKRDLEVQELKRHRFEREEEANRFKILLQAQVHRNQEQLVTIDKYHAAVASHEAETRQMQVLLENEREEAKRQLEKLQTAYVATRHTLEQQIDVWKMSFEDVLSRVNFNPAAEKIALLEAEVAELRKELKEKNAFISAEIEKVRTREAEINKRDARIRELKVELDSTTEEREAFKIKSAKYLLEFERQAFARCDAEHRTERIKQNTEAFDTMKATLEKKISEAHLEIEQLTAELNKPKADAEVQVMVFVEEDSSQTDLTYQYLESSHKLQNDPKRRERLDALQKASNFVDDPQYRRDFTANRHAGGTANTVNLKLDHTNQQDPLTHGKQRLIYAPISKNVAPIGAKTDAAAQATATSNLRDRESDPEAHFVPSPPRMRKSTAATPPEASPRTGKQARAAAVASTLRDNLGSSALSPWGQ